MLITTVFLSFLYGLHTFTYQPPSPKPSTILEKKVEQSSQPKIRIGINPGHDMFNYYSNWGAEDRSFDNYEYLMNLRVTRALTARFNADGRFFAENTKSDFRYTPAVLNYAGIDSLLIDDFYPSAIDTTFGEYDNVFTRDSVFATLKKKHLHKKDRSFPHNKYRIRFEDRYLSAHFSYAIEIHHNSDGITTKEHDLHYPHSGFEIFFEPANAKLYTESKRFAFSVSKSMQEIRRKNTNLFYISKKAKRYIKKHKDREEDFKDAAVIPRTGLLALEHTKIPHILIECDHLKNLRKLKNLDDYVEETAQAIYEGTLAFFKLEEVPMIIYPFYKPKLDYRAVYRNMMFTPSARDKMYVPGRNFINKH